MACPFENPRHLFDDLEAIRQKPGLEYSKALNGYVVSRYDDIISVLDRPAIFSSRPAVPEFPETIKGIFAGKVPEKGTLLGWDNPDHDRLRKSVATFFVPRRLERFEPLLRATAHDLIDGFAEAGSVEIKSAFALPLPLRAIVIVAGLDPARWEWIGRCLSLFGGITKTDRGVSFEEKVKDVLDLHEYVASVIEERRTDRKDDLISHIWNERDAGNVTMTDFEHLGMIPGLLLAGHETTTNMLTMGLSHFLHYGLWDEASASNESRKLAVEELLRFESAITGMPRLVTAVAEVGGTTLRPGDRLFGAYNSGSRDASKFSDPHVLDFKKHRTTQHLGFGRGIHACLGAPFARLLLRTELAVIRERLPGLRLETPYDEIQYHPVHEGRSPIAVQIAWDVSLSRMMKIPVQVDPKSPAITVHGRMEDRDMIVTSAVKVADDVLVITLTCEGESRAPAWTAGAHIDVKAGPFGYRQYSLCSDPSDRRHLKIAVLRNGDSGASHHLHASTVAGTKLAIRGPRNNFNLGPSTRRTVFIAGGIGITPIMPMAAAALASGADYSLIYLGRSKSHLAFADILSELHREKCTIWTTDEHNGSRFDLNRYFLTEDTEGLRVYCCGPESLLSSVEDALSEAPPGVLCIERFANPVATNDKNTAFDVVMARSGRILKVPEDQSVLDIVNEAGANVMSTCNKGLCGTCEVGVVRGLVEHRDAVLTVSERAEGKTMMACVSRCRGTRLELDLW